jgi:polysaccharide biosynthesis protein PslH
MVRTANLLRSLARTNDVRQLAVAVDGPAPRRARIDREPTDEGYLELLYHHPLAWATARLCARSWVRSNIGAGAVLRTTSPRTLPALLRWADVVLVEFPWQFEACRRAAPPGMPLVLASHNVESEKFPSWALADGAPRHRRELWLRYIERAERAAVAGADLVIAVSERDRDTFVSRFGKRPERVVLAPNGTDTQRIRPTPPTTRPAARRALGLPERPTVLFQAADMPANLAGLGWVRRLAQADPRRTYLVVGSVAEPHPDDHIVATGPVPEMAPFLAAADAALCPIAHGGGTKIKLLESMAAGLPLVAFAEALRGTVVRDGEHVLVAEPSERSLLRCLDALEESLLAEPPDASLPDVPSGLARSRGEELAANARQLVEERYDWARIAAGLDAALHELVSATAPTSAALALSR